MNDYQKEQIRCYKQRLESMSEVEFAEECMVSLQFSAWILAVCLVVSVIAFLTLPISGPLFALFGLVVFCAPFMVVEYLSLRKILDKDL